MDTPLPQRSQGEKIQILLTIQTVVSELEMIIESGLEVRAALKLPVAIKKLSLIACEGSHFSREPSPS